MKFRFFLISFFLTVPFYAGCVSAGAAVVSTEIDTGITEIFEQPWVIDNHQNSISGRNIPDWVAAWLGRGNHEAENLDEFKNSYVFIAANTGTNFDALKQWQDNFSVEQDFARLAAIRVENRFLMSLTGYPDDEFGAYYFSLIRAASDKIWEGAVRKDVFWFSRHYSGSSEEQPENAAPPVHDDYVFLVLVTIEKRILVPQLSDLLKSINPVPPLTREQNSAVRRVQADFLTGF